MVARTYVTLRPNYSNNIMPSRKKKSKAKGRKPAVGKGGMKAEENLSVNEEQEKGTLNSEMRRLKIGEPRGEQQGDEDDALLEQAIILAEQEMKVKGKENCTHGYNPSSIFQARYCEDFVKKFLESYYSATRGDSRLDGLNSVIDAFGTTITTSTVTTYASRNKSNKECISSCCLAKGTKFILDGKSDDAPRLCAVLASYMKRADEGELPDFQKIMELLDADEHTLVQFFRKQIPCSCLDEKYKQVKSITKMGICYNEGCPLPGKMAVRSKMFRCTGCLNYRYVSYCSRECQEAHWPRHKEFCGKTTQEIAAFLTSCACRDDAQE